MDYANRRRPAGRALATPRNMQAVDTAVAEDAALVISFVGDTTWRNPTVYCDVGKHYAWDFVRGLQTIIAVRPGAEVVQALAGILAQSDAIRDGYPVLVDVERKEVAYIVHGNPLQLWPLKRGTVLWQQFFGTPA